MAHPRRATAIVAPLSRRIVSYHSAHDLPFPRQKAAAQAYFFKWKRKDIKMRGVASAFQRFAR
jgi:hypothetical protein